MPNNWRMNHENQNPTAARACLIFGGQAAFARALGVSSPTVNQWVSGKRRVPVERCAQIEIKSKGKITRKDLRPDDYWLIWPELKKQQEVTR